MRPSSCGSLASLSDGRCCVGIPRRWVGAWGLMSRTASSPPRRLTIVAGISPAATLQKRQPVMRDPLPAERLADLLPELLAAPLLRRRLRLDFSELLEESLLFRCETRGGPDPHPHVQVAPPALTQPRQALAPHAVHRARLRSGLDLEHHGSPPYGVGISTSPPSAAWPKEIGRSNTRSSPWRSNRGSWAMSSTATRSPGGPLRGPGTPWPRIVR